MYYRITLITLHVVNNLLAQIWSSVLSERAVYLELELWQRLKQIFIAIECGIGCHTSKTTMPYETQSPSNSWHNFNPKIIEFCPSIQTQYQLIRTLFWINTLPHLQTASCRQKQYISLKHCSPHMLYQNSIIS